MPRRCNARISLPGVDGRTQVIFTCNQQSDHAVAAGNIAHTEKGRVKGLDGKVRTYELFWHDAASEAETWRELRQPAPTTVDYD